MNDTTKPENPPTTPVVERIANQGVRFAKFYPAWIPLIPTWRPLVVFLVLLSHADMNGDCCLMRSTIAREAQIDIRHASRAIRFLESIEAVKTFPAIGRPSRYQVSFQPPLAVLAKGQPLAETAKTPLAETAHHNRPREERSLTEFTTTRARANEKSDDKANDLADAYAAQTSADDAWEAKILRQNPNMIHVLPGIRRTMKRSRQRSAEGDNAEQA